MVRRILLLITCALVMLMVAQTALGQSAASQSPRRPAVSILVFPFLPEDGAARDPRNDWLGDAVAELATSRIAGEGRIVFSRQEFQIAAERNGLPGAPGTSARFTRATMLRLGEQLDADFLVFGQFAAEGKSLRLVARVIRMNAVAQSPALVEGGAPENFSDLHSALCWQILKHIEPGYPFSRQEFLRRTPRLRLDAIENYVRGWQSNDDGARLKLWRAAAQAEPEWSDPAYALATGYFTAKDYANAAPWYARVPLQEERGREAAFNAGLCYFLRNDLIRAEGAWAALVDHTRTLRGGAPPAAMNNLAVVRARLEKREDAAALLQRAALQAPEDEDYWFNLGVLQLRGADLTPAVRAFREALKRAPDDVMARALFIYALEQAGRTTEATSERESYSSSLPAVTPATLSSLERVKRQLEAPVAPLAVQSLSPRRAESLRRHLAQGQESLAAKRWPEAERHFAAAALLAPDSREAHAGLAEALENQNRLEEAVREWRAALYVREDPELRVHLARVLLDFDPQRTDEARVELRAALRTNPPPGLREEARRLLEGLNAPAAGARP